MDTLEDHKKRRSKKDSQGRIFTCHCGKSYLSYQALYTHKRSKHAELIPNDENTKKKRGRPKGSKTETTYDPCFPLGNNPLAEKIAKFKDFERINNCDTVFAEFLMDRSKKLSKKEYKSLANSVIYLRDCINMNYNLLNDSNFIGQNQEYTKSNTPDLIPKISNVYILKYLPENKTNYNKDSEVQFMLEICDWLMSKNYTDLEVTVIS